MTLKDLKALADYCKKNGITKVKTGDVEMEFGPSAAPALDPKIAKALADALGSDELSPEQTMFFSAGQPIDPSKLRG
jgi:hypothetical protein